MRGWSSCALLSAGLCLLGCGRLGFAPSAPPASGTSQTGVDGSMSMHAFDAGAGAIDAGRVSRISTNTLLDGGALFRPPASDASVRPPASRASAPVPVGAAVPAAANGGECSSATDCVSGTCVNAVCCAQACDSPPLCHDATNPSCSDGVVCTYPAMSGGSCDDGNPCTTNDYCFAGTCLGAFPNDCNDQQDCTSDFCAVGGCAHASSCNPSAAGCSYELQAGHGYWLCPGPVSYSVANSECERLGAGIVTINDQDEQAFLWSQGMRDTWIGYTTLASAADGGFTWAASSSDFVDWADGEPDAGADTCAYLSAAHGGGWEGRACDTGASGFACEFERHVPPDANCVYARRADRGYYICATARTVQDAQQRCMSTGTTLAEIGDVTEQAFLLARLSSGASYAIGLNDVTTEGIFVWFSGAPPTYFAWGAGQPASTTADQDYVVMVAGSGDWQTVTPTERQFYICEEPHEP